MINSQKKNEEFEYLIKICFELLSRYIKDQKQSDSWIFSYGKIFNVKFPVFNFVESYGVFAKKITKMLDLMELSHLYCKVSDSNVYNKDTHTAVSAARQYMANVIETLTEEEFIELREHLKNSIIFGNN